MSPQITQIGGTIYLLDIGGNLSILLECDDKMKCKQFSHHQYNLFGSIKISARTTHFAS